MKEIENNHSLLEEINSARFDIFNCVTALYKHYSNIGITHYLVEKLKTYSYEEIEFFIPQFLQILITIESNSMGLENFILEYCETYPHFGLLCFWNLQAHIHELRNDPESFNFQIVRRLINSLQNILFNDNLMLVTNHHINHDKFKENLFPSLILAGTIGGLFGMPAMNEYIHPLIRSQGKQQRSFVFKLANFQKTLTKNLTLKNRKLTQDENVELKRSVSVKDSRSDHKLSRSQSVNSLRGAPTTSSGRSRSSSSVEVEMESDDDEYDKHLEYKKTRDSPPMTFDLLNKIDNLNINTTITSKKRISSLTQTKSTESVKSHTDLSSPPPQQVSPLNTQSLPDLTKTSYEESRYSFQSERSEDFSKPNSPSLSAQKKYNTTHLTTGQKEKFLKTNYFKLETQFTMALTNISFRLSSVPKEARLSSLRAELSILNRNLPLEIDIPQLLPNKKGKYSKILKIDLNEAAVLNSAERVPFLLLIEVLHEEMDFNPTGNKNKFILENGGGNLEVDSFMDKKLDAFIEPVHEETDLGDVSVIKLSNTIANEEAAPYSPKIMTPTPSSTNVLDNNLKDLATQIRIASVMLQQLESKNGIDVEIASIKNRIIESMKDLQNKFDKSDYSTIGLIGEENAGERKYENDFKLGGVQSASNKNELGEDWLTKKQRIRQSSPYGHLSNWDLFSVIAKNGDDLVQESFACQLIHAIHLIWNRNKVDVWVKKMRILVTSSSTGLVETITNAVSVHSIKKTLTELSIQNGTNPRGSIVTLKDYFVRTYGEPTSMRYRKAQDNFAKSLAAYSIICYILQIKDRHNGNIMLDNEGHIVHIDFGFLLSNSPGSVGFEAAPFKLTFEYIDLLDGPTGEPFLKFKRLCQDAFKVLRKNSNNLVDLIKMMQKDSSLPCFKNGESTSILFEKRFQLQMNDNDIDNFVDTQLVGKSMGSYYTRLYDQFQLITQGIYS